MTKKKTPEEKEELKKTAAVSKERLNRITKTRKHHLRTNHRVIKYGAKSFIRNTWLSVAAIAIMVVTLVVLSATLIAADAMRTAIRQVEHQIDISIYFKQGATQDQIDEIVKKIKALDSVAEVKVLSPEEANRRTNEKIISEFNITDQDLIRTMREAPNKISWTLNVKMESLDNTGELEDFVNRDDAIQNLLDETKKPSFASSHRANEIQIVGLAAAGVFAIIAILVVFNTIRMAIFNRKEEIYMMKLVGASRWFIVGPFVVEASIYGIIAAIVSCAAIYISVYFLRPYFEGMLDSTYANMTQYWYLVGAALLIVGILIGVISSLLATRKYLKQR